VFVLLARSSECFRVYVFFFETMFSGVRDVAFAFWEKKLPIVDGKVNDDSD